MGVLISNTKFPVRINRFKDSVMSVFGHIVFGLFIVVIVGFSINPLYVLYIDIKKERYATDADGSVLYVMNESEYSEYFENKESPVNFEFVVVENGDRLIKKFYFRDGRVKSYYGEGSIQTLYVRTYIAAFTFMAGLLLLTISRVIWLCSRSFLVSSEYKKPVKIELLTMIYGLSLMISAFIVGGSRIPGHPLLD